MIPLTPELIEERLAHLTEIVDDAHGPIIASLFRRVGCDECGFVFDLEWGYPVGWTTEGDLQRGWVDHCRACSTPLYQCPQCDAVSFHPEDIRLGYCGRCHAFTR